MYGDESNETIRSLQMSQHDLSIISPTLQKSFSRALKYCLCNLWSSYFTKQNTPLPLTDMPQYHTNGSWLTSRFIVVVSDIDGLSFPSISIQITLLGSIKAPAQRSRNTPLGVNAGSDRFSINPLRYFVTIFSNDEVVTKSQTGNVQQVHLFCINQCRLDVGVSEHLGDCLKRHMIVD